MKFCRVCGLQEDEHHAFDPIEMPEGCVCDPCEWKVMKPICDKYEGDGVQHCKKCEHWNECHR